MTTKTACFEGWAWFKFNNLRLALGTNLKFYTSVAKELKLKFRKFQGLIPTFVEVTGEKLVGESFCPPSPPLPPSSVGLINYFSTTLNAHPLFKTKIKWSPRLSIFTAFSKNWYGALKYAEFSRQKIAALFNIFFKKSLWCQFQLYYRVKNS